MYRIGIHPRQVILVLVVLYETDIAGFFRDKNRSEVLYMNPIHLDLINRISK